MTTSICAILLANLNDAQIVTYLCLFVCVCCLHSCADCALGHFALLAFYEIKFILEIFSLTDSRAKREIRMQLVSEVRIIRHIFFAIEFHCFDKLSSRGKWSKVADRTRRPQRKTDASRREFATPIQGGRSEHN